MVQTGEDDSNDDEAESVMELDVELEDDLCKLWDASINEVRILSQKLYSPSVH